MPQNKHAIQHRFLLIGAFSAASPIRIANGKGDHADLVILRDHQGFPYIPSSSLAGVLRAKWMKADFQNPVSPQTEKYFWGNTANPGEYAAQSHFRIHNLELFMPEEAVTAVRDGVSIDPATGTVDGTKKYDYEVLEPRGRMKFKAEITVRKGADFDEIRQIVLWLRQNLANGLQVGGNTSKGFGILESRDLKCYHFDFSSEATRESHAKAWLSYCRERKVKEPLPSILFEEKKCSLNQVQANDLVLKAKFELDHSLIIGGPGPIESLSQKTHLHSRKKPVISGSSLMGAMRHRAGRILKIAGVDQAEDKLNALFGYNGEDEDKISRSRIETRETEVKSTQSGLQTRIRVDRFTHAPVNGALFDSEPLWPAAEEASAPCVDFYWRIRDYQDGEAALLMHLLRDIWTRDLPIGGEKSIGRGRLLGKSMTLSAPGFQITVEDKEGKLEIKDDKKVLSRFDSPLNTLEFTENKSKNNE